MSTTPSPAAMRVAEIIRYRRPLYAEDIASLIDDALAPLVEAADKLVGCDTFAEFFGAQEDFQSVLRDFTPQEMLRFTSDPAAHASDRGGETSTQEPTSW